MEGHDPHIIMRLKTRDPIEIGDFVSAFTALGNEYERFIRAYRPDLAPEAQIYVREVREGSIEAELIPWAVAGVTVMINNMDKILILEEFVRLYGGRLMAFFKPGGRLPDASKSELVDFMGQVLAVANDRDGSAEIEAVQYEDQQRQVRAAVKFRTPEARTARAQIVEQRKELQNRGDIDHERVLMRFVRPSIEDAKLGQRTGERAIIDKVHAKALPVVYASELAEQRIRHEMLKGHENVFRKLFDVDVNVELRADGRPLAYRIVAVHTITDMPDEEEA
ncbi:MAG TPA: hypothetical protein VGX37_02620 [Allosphingosinicella sp.]|nr:hypothetical protein [Allosphingosinicella sp.]